MNIITFQIDKYVQKFSFLMITEPILTPFFKKVSKFFKTLQRIIYLWRLNYSFFDFLFKS